MHIFIAKFIRIITRYIFILILTIVCMPFLKPSALLFILDLISKVF